VTGRSEGLEWPIEGLQFDPMRCIGTSNRALGPVRAEADGPGLLMMVPRRYLAAVLQALAG
jgi:thiamine pyrophosphokinase